jgi:hypothetical protein
MIMDAAMIANAFPLMPQRHAAASAVLSFDLKDMCAFPCRSLSGRMSVGV